MVEESGAPLAAQVSPDDVERQAQIEQVRARRFAVVDRMRQPFADVPEEELEREIARAAAEGHPC